MSGPLRFFFIGGGGGGVYLPIFDLRDPTNHQRTYLPTVADEKRVKIEISTREHYVFIFAGETEDSCPKKWANVP